MEEANFFRTAGGDHGDDDDGGHGYGGGGGYGFKDGRDARGRIPNVDIDDMAMLKFY